jgi:polysaccharide biosynthesis protein VpsM
MSIKWTALFIIVTLFAPLIGICPAESSSTIVSNNSQLKQVATFKVKKNAEKFARKLKDQGYETEIRKDTSKDNKTLYRVFAGKIRNLSKNTLPSDETQIAVLKTFGDIEDAVRFAEELNNKGYETVLKSDITGDSTIIYTVFAKKHMDQSQDALSPGKIGDEAESRGPSVTEEDHGKENLYGELKAQSDDTPSSQEITKEPPPPINSPAEKSVMEGRPAVLPDVLSSTISSVGETRSETAPLPPTENITSGTPKGKEYVFGTRKGFLHPFLAISGYYTDNVFYTKYNRQSDFATVITPGIWLTFPHVNERLLSIDTSNLSPGGFSLSRYSPQTFKRYQSYLTYSADIEMFSNNSSGNDITHKAGGLLQYNLRSGLSFEFADNLLFSHDIRGTGISGVTTELDKFWNNLANFIVTYDSGNRLKFRIDYTNFLLNYDASRNKFRDRVDNTFSSYIFYKVRPKTSVFVEYEFADINYATDASSNARGHSFFGGIQWDITAKSKGSIKAGYGVRESVNTTIGNSNNFILEAQIDHKFTPKTSLILKASRKTDETNVAGTNFIVADTLEVTYLQRITGKLTGNIILSYTNDQYNGALTYNGITKPLEEDYYSGALALSYKFREWIQLDVGYKYEKRISSFSEFDYVTNLIFFRINGSL